MSTPERWDIFCRVVDNFGDAGVCWRLARLLASEHAASVRLCIDDLETLGRLHPDVRDAAMQRVDGIDVMRWDEASDIAPESVEVIVDAFGCGPPETYLERAAAADEPPLWIVLEYLSAEPWVSGHHGLPSPHPRLPLERYFFFPGFTADTAGLLREGDLLARRDAFDASHAAALWRGLGFAPLPAAALSVFVFAYAFAPLHELLSAWAEGRQSVVAVIPEGVLAAEARRFFGAGSGATLTRGRLEARFVPFVPQARFDELLWACDVAFVRGEDSFVRAQWAAKPFVWHIYAQAEDAHRLKLDAFLDLYSAGLAPEAATALRELSYAWNRLGGAPASTASAWAAFARCLPGLREHARAWSARLAQSGELAANLARFCSDKLK